MWGQQEFYWISFYLFPETIGIVKYKEKDSILLKFWKQIAESAHWWWPYENIVFVSDRPIVKTNSNKILHCDNGPAVEYPDGYCQYYLNGRSVPEWLACTASEKIKPKDVLKIENAEVRAQGIKKIGLKRVSDSAIEVEKKGVYELLDFSKLIGLDYAPYLKMINPSTGETHIEGVHPDCKTIQHAINWRASGNIKKTWKPVILT
jgi:hypothetical protein